LDHESPDFRFVASESLKSITGLPSLYLAHANERQRRAAVAKWRRQLSEEKIVHRPATETERLLAEQLAAPAPR
jgi:hypothetical protein